MDQRELQQMLAAAAAANRAGRREEAERCYRDVLARWGEQPVALNGLGMIALGKGAPQDAAVWFDRAIKADPGSPELWMNLAKAWREHGSAAEEQRALSGALAIDQRYFMAHVRSAELSERVGDAPNAAHHWRAVMALAPQIDAPPAAIAEHVARGTTFVARHDAAFAAALDAPLARARDGAGVAALRRFDTCVEVALGRRALFTNQCHGLHYPFLPADEFFERPHFPWLAELEAQTLAIRAEAEALLRDRADAVVPYVSQAPGTPENKWTLLNNSKRWGAYFFWKHGVRDDVACARFPATAAALERVPRSDIPGRSPTAFFSVLEPRTRIPSHTGVTNTRAIIHLPLIVPPGCGFRVGGETREWSEGHAFAFDDTIEHEAWNDSDALRVVLILDVWNPHLDEDERRLLRAFFEASDASGFAAPREG